MDICLLGTGGMLPLCDRFLTSCYIEQGGRAVLIDCGEGTQVAAAAAKAKISRIEAILITHAHADHVTGLPGLLLSVANTGKTSPLEIYFPASAQGIITALLTVAGWLPYEIRLVPLGMSGETVFPLTCIDPMLEVRALPLRHSVDCIGYSLTLTHKRVFLPERADALGVPPNKRGILHSGGSITVEGREITPDMVTAEPRPPQKLTYVTDTLPLDEIADFAKGSRLFICEGMYGDRAKKPDMDKKGHMLMQDACGLAARAGAECLWLTHYSPAESDPSAFEAELKELFPAVVISTDGQRTAL